MSESPHRPPRSPRFWWIVGSLGVAAMTAVAIWFGLAMTVGQVQWSDAGFQIHDESSIEVRFDVVREPGRAVTCRLEALDDHKAFVGSTQVEVAPATESRTRQVASVDTIARARTGYVESCWYADDNG